MKPLSASFLIRSFAAICGIGLIGLVSAAPVRITHPVARTIQSPDGRLKVELAIPPLDSQETPKWSATFRGKPILTDCKLDLDIVREGSLLSGAAVLRESNRSGDSRIKVLFGKADHVQDRYAEYRLSLKAPGKHQIDITLRCYDDAIAFRYEVPKQEGSNKLVVQDEKTTFGLSGDPTSYIQYLENFQTSHEHNITTTSLHEIKPDTLLDTPATFAYPDGTHLAITEAALRHYPGMSLMNSNQSLACKLAPKADGTKVETTLPMKTPWRVVLVGDRAGALLESNALYCLNEPSAIKDTSWIKPGKMSWPWWNGNVVSDGKPDPPIFNLESQKLYIDFCAANNIAFHSTIADNTDTPWYFQTKPGIAPGPDTDVTKVRPGLDLPAILQYARSKGVRSWTWVHQGALRGHVEEAFAAFERLGWSGMMVDFFDHDDQDSVEHAEAILTAAAKHHILIHFHGIWKPTGWQRTFPNLMNHEGSLNLEYLKWSNRCTPEHTLNVLSTRMVAGPMDYHLGGFRAVNADKFAIHFAAPNVFGTRCFMLAAYVCIDNPNPMVADYPDAYKDQPGFDFIKLVPTWWDETRVLVSDVGKVLVTARRKGRSWYVGCMSSTISRDLDIPLEFLGSGNYNVTRWSDSAKTEADPNELAKKQFMVSSHDKLAVHVCRDGGFVAQFTPIK